MGYKVAVVGATGNVGREMLDILAERRFPRRRGGGARLAQEHGSGMLVRRQDAEGEGARPLRFLRRRHLPDVGGRRGIEGMVAEDRRAGRGGDRQFVGLAHGPGRAADRAGGERRRGRRLHQEEHHRQPELLDRAARGRAQAAARRGHDQARGGGDLPVGVGRRQGRDGRTVLADQGASSRSARSRPRSSPSASPSTSFRTSTSSWRTATPRKNGR